MLGHSLNGVRGMEGARIEAAAGGGDLCAGAEALYPSLSARIVLMLV